MSTNSPRVSNALDILLWALAGTAGFYFAIHGAEAALIDGTVIPLGVDSFYQARRVLDALATTSIWQFDPLMYAPEGTIVYWPWLYTGFIALIAQLSLAIAAGLTTTALDPLSFILFIPPVWIFFNVAVLLLITKQLELPLLYRLLALFFFALSGLTQAVHTIGRIDHHYFELTATLLVLWAGIQCFKFRQSSIAALIFGAVLGLCPGIQIGLFILQLPLLAAYFVLWIQNRTLTLKTILPLSLGLVATTTAITLPSLAFQEGYFSYQLLSWFHIYIALSTSILLIYLTRFRFQLHGLLGLIFISALLMLPVMYQLIEGGSYVVSSIEGYRNIAETRSLFSMLAFFGLYQNATSYSLLLFLLPVALIVSLLLLTKPNTPPFLVYFFVVTVFCAALMVQQYRFHSLGNFTLFLPILVLAERVPLKRLYSRGVVSLLFLAAMIPFLFQLKVNFVIPYTNITFNSLGVAEVKAMHPQYRTTYPVYQVLSNICKDYPGIVLAPVFAGHFIRFHSDCSVMASPMHISAHHLRKIDQIQSYYEMTPQEFLEANAEIEYVFATFYFHQSVRSASNEASSPLKFPLVESLLKRPETLPQEFQPLIRLETFAKTEEGNFGQRGKKIPYAALYRIVR